MTTKDKVMNNEIKWSGFYTKNAKRRAKRFAKKETKKFNRRMAKDYINSKMIELDN